MAQSGHVHHHPEFQHGGRQTGNCKVSPKFKIKDVVSPLADKISLKFQQHYLDFGSISPLEWIRILCDLTGSGKIQDGRQKTSNACRFASIQGNTQDITGIPTAKPTFLRSSIPLGLMRILCDKTRSGKIQDGGLLTSSACIFASRQDINEIPTAIPMLSGFSFP